MGRRAAGLSWPLALVFDAIALATGPTVVNSLVRQVRLPHFLSQVLEAEGLLLEPFSAVLALLLLQSALGDGASWPDQAQRLVAHYGGGVAAGALGGWVSRGFTVAPPALMRLKLLMKGFLAGPLKNRLRLTESSNLSGTDGASFQ